MQTIKSAPVRIVADELVMKTSRRFTLLTALVVLAGCGGNGAPTSPTPVAPSADLAEQFDSLWRTFDRQYSYFQYKNIDWNALREQYRPRALAASDQQGLASVIREMLGTLHDLHVVIRTPSGGTIATYSPQRFVNWDRAVWQQYLARGSWTQAQADFGYGRLNGVAYVAIGRWSSSGISISAFDDAMETMRNASALIIDVRMNPGGDDSLAYQVAGRFTTRSVRTGSYKFRNGPSHSDFDAPTIRTLSPRGSWQFTKPVFLLIGKACVSSNESFIEAMRQLPHVTLVGDQTGGASANPGTFPLFGGWTYTVSRWIEYTADGQVIEDVGIAPHVFIPASATDFVAGRDPVLDWALGHAPAAARSGLGDAPGAGDARLAKTWSPAY